MAVACLPAFVLLLLATLSISNVVSDSDRAFQFDVSVGRSRCIGEDVRKGELFRARYSFNPDLPGIVSVSVLDPFQKEIPKRSAEKNSIVHTADQSGEHRICFFSVGGIPVTVELDLTSGSDAKKWDEIAKQENLKPLEVELRRLEDIVSSIQSEFEYISQREQLARDVNENTNSRVLWGSVLSMMILVGLGTWQIYYLQKFFKSKKMM